MNGDLEVLISLPEKYFQYGMELYVDDEVVAFGGGVDELEYLNPQPYFISKEFSNTLRKLGIQNKTCSFHINTTNYKNGTHLITIKDSKGHSASCSVIFKNTISEIKSDGIINLTDSKICHISAYCDSPPCRVVIREDTVPPVAIRSFTVNSNKIDIDWDGKDERGKQAPADTYTVEFQAGSPPYATKGLSKLDN